MDLTLFPKVELHIHLDCSLSYEVVKEIDPSISRETYLRNFVGPVQCHDLLEYLRYAEAGIAMMQTADQLRLVTLDFMRQMQEDGVIYVEIRFAPLEHTRQGLTPEKVIESVASAMRQGEMEFGVSAGLILCTLRHYQEKDSLRVAHLAHAFMGHGVVGFDMAGDEPNYPIDLHIAAFQFARGNGVPCTCHAGEARGADSVSEVLDHLQPERIGHGVRSSEDPVLTQRLVKENIHLEVCPSSNVQTHVYENITQHQIDQLYKKGVSLSINTDSRAICQTTLSREFKLMISTFEWGLKDLEKCTSWAIDHAFTSDANKQRLHRLIAKYKL